MKKVGLIKLLVGLTLAASGAFAVGSAVSNKKVVPVHASTAFNDAAVYLDTSSCWKSGNNDERFAVYWSTGTETGWYSMVDIATNFYAARLPEKDITLIIFCRMNKSNSTNDWSNKYNQSGDITTFTNTSAVFKVDTWDGATASCWKANSGYTSKFSSRYVACADNNWSENNNNYKLSLDMTKAEARLEKDFLVSGEETYEAIKLTDGTWTNSYGCQYVASGTNSNYIDTSEGSNNNIRLKVSGTYEIYWKYHETNGKNIWLQISSSSEADAYAQTFISSITCTDNSVTSELSVWNKVGNATTSMEYKFENLTSGARHLLQQASVNENGSNIEKCVAKYDRILGKYGYGTAAGQYHDFMGRTPAPISGGAKLVLPTIGNNNSNTIAIIVIISLVSVTAIGGFFFIRKRREN